MLWPTASGRAPPGRQGSADIRPKRRVHWIDITRLPLPMHFKGLWSSFEAAADGAAGELLPFPLGPAPHGLGLHGPPEAAERSGREVGGSGGKCFSLGFEVNGA